MKRTVLVFAVCVGLLSCADNVSFIQAYDAGKYDTAAELLQGVDISNPGIARRVGVMYYNAKGVKGDQERGRSLLEQAMMAGDSTAAINLAKIYFKLENNVPKAAWCLMVAECLGDTSVLDDIARLKGFLGDDYNKGVMSYISQLRGLLADEQAALRSKSEAFDRERAAAQNEIAKLTAELAQEREEKLAEKQRQEIVRADAERTKKQLEDNLKNLENSLYGEKRSLEARLNASRNDMEVAQKNIDGYRKIVRSMEIEPLDLNVEPERVSSKQIFSRYNQLVQKYNTLVRKYNNLLHATEDRLR